MSPDVGDTGEDPFDDRDGHPGSICPWILEHATFRVSMEPFLKIAWGLLWSVDRVHILSCTKKSLDMFYGRTAAGQESSPKQHQKGLTEHLME